MNNIILLLNERIFGKIVWISFLFYLFRFGLHTGPRIVISYFRDARAAIFE